MPRSSVAVPSTPARSWARIIDAFKPIGRKRRARSPRFIYAILSKNHAGHVSIAIQNDDEAEDAVIITTLDEIPFCCHADLLTMNHEELLVVANSLNSKLPAVLGIDLQRTDAYIRNSIELIVGLRQNAPNAPIKATATTTDPARNSTPMSPMSPLAMRNRSQGSYMAMVGSPNLAVVKEEAEEEVEVEVLLTRQDDDIQPRIKRRRVEKPSVTAVRRVTRSQSARVPNAATSSIAFPLVTRSQSQKLSNGRELPFMRNASFKTSTPKRNKSSNSLDTPGRLSVSSPLSSPSVSSARSIKRRRSSKSEDDTELTFGIEGMTMLADSSGLDFSMD